MEIFYRPILGLLLSLFFIYSIDSHAQSFTVLKGKLEDGEGKAIPFANLALRSLPDSLVKKIGVSRENGTFQISGMEPGTYFMESYLIGFKRFKSQIISFSAGQEMDLGSIKMESTDVKLGEVTVVAQKPAITVEPDKLILNVENSPLMINTNALDILRKAPGVVVNQDEQIFLQGKNGLLIYIDGRQSPLSEKDLANWLRSIPSSQIESIEVITNPSARYDAAGNAGIINIRLKRNKKKGMNGSISSGFSYGLANENNYARTNQSLTLNHGGEKVNLFFNYGYDYSRSWSFMDIYRIQSDQVFDQKTNDFNRNQSHNSKFGADWRINKKHIFSVTVDGNLSSAKNRGESENKISALGDMNPNRILEAENQANRQTGNYNFNFNHQFKDTSGREFVTDANYGGYVLNNSTFQPNFYKNEDSTTTDRSFGLNTPVRISFATIKSDYEQKTKSTVFGVGYKISNVLTDNEFGYYNRIGGLNERDLTQSSTFTYLERVLAGYVSVRHTLNTKITLQAGLRVESTQSEGNLKAEIPGGDSLNKRTYTDPFPSAGISFKSSQNHVFNLNYSRRIDRPVYRFLNPFKYKLDELSYEQGNPFLNPQYTHNIQLGYTVFSMATASVGFSQTDQFFARVIDSLGQLSFLTRRNLAKVNTVSFNLSSPLPISKWWNGFFNFTYNHQEYSANFGNGKTLFLPVDYFNVYMQHSFTFKEGLNGQISGYYNSPNVWGGTFRNRRFWSMEVGFSKKILKNKGTISLTVSDLFLSQRWKGRSDFGGINMTVGGGYDSRQLRFGFSWIFGGEEVKPIRKKVGNSEERQRLKGE